MEGPDKRWGFLRLSVRKLSSFLSLMLVLGACALLLWRAPVPVVPDVVLVGPVDRILIEKGARRMTAFQNGQALKIYKIALGFQPVGHKAAEGDGRTPEGIYRIDRRNDRSAYHLSLGIDYPRPQDIARAQEADVSPGGDIFIHGQPNLMPAGITLRRDWTAGCIAISDAEIRELFAATPIGTTVEIRP